MDSKVVTEKVILLDGSRKSNFLDSCRVCKEKNKGKEIMSDENNIDRKKTDGHVSCACHRVDDSFTTNHGEWSVVKSRKSRRTGRK